MGAGERGGFRKVIYPWLTSTVFLYYAKQTANILSPPKKKTILKEYLK